MKQTLRSVIFIVGTLGWWGFVYPDLCLTPEECTAEESAATAETNVVWECIPSTAETPKDAWQAEKNSIRGAAATPKDGQQAGANSMPGAEATLKDNGTKEIRIKSRLYEYVCQVREKG